MEVSVFFDILQASEVPSEKQFQKYSLYPIHIGQSGIVYHFSNTSIAEEAYKSPENRSNTFLSWDGSEKSTLVKTGTFYQDCYL